MKRLLIIDFLNKNKSHLNFNNSFIMAIKSNQCNINFIGVKSHCNEISDKNINIRAIADSKGSWVTQVIKIFFKVILSRKERSIIVLAIDNYISPLLFSLFSPLFLRKKLTIVIHNNIRPLVKSKIKRIPFLLFSKLINHQFICLTKSGYDAMIKMGFNKTFFIKHMNFSHQNSISKKVDIKFPKNKTNIVFVGRQAKFFVEEIMTNLNLAPYTNLNLIVLYKKELPIKEKCISQYKDWVEDEQLIYLLETADFSFFHNHNVEYRPSGILLDSISNNCPIIAPEIGHFLETKEYNIGYYYKDNISLIQLFDNLNKKGIKRNSFPNKNFESAQNLTALHQFSKEINALI